SGAVAGYFAILPLIVSSTTSSLCAAQKGRFVRDASIMYREEGSHLMHPIGRNPIAVAAPDWTSKRAKVPLRSRPAARRPSGDIASDSSDHGTLVGLSPGTTM